MWDCSFHSTTKSHHKVTNWPNFNITVSQGIGRPEEKERGGNGQWVEQSGHTHFIDQVCHLPGHSSWCPKTITTRTSQIAITRIMIMTKSETVRITKMWLREQMLLEKMVLIDLLDTGLPQTFNLYKKMRYLWSPIKWGTLYKNWASRMEMTSFNLYTSD